MSPKILSYETKQFNNAGLNGGYYSGGLQQAHSTTPLEAPHSAGPHVPPSVSTPQSAVPTAPPAAVPPPTIQHALLNKSVNDENRD